MSIQYSVTYSNEALEDLREIYTYIAEDLLVPEIAKDQIHRIQRGVRALNTMPSRFKRVDWEPLQSMGIHQMPVNNYVVFYLINEQSYCVMISRIYYGGRNIEDLSKDILNETE